ncbi:hypothetical protein PI124_g11682 [Phytophthora idaei]|nr:hypothetical protein PI124_g11682 [Phytophthora idaei]
MLNPEEWTCFCIFRVTRLLPCRHVTYLRKATNFARLLDESVLHPRWLLKNYRHLKSTTTSSANVEDPFEIRDIHPPDVTSVKTQIEIFKELQGAGKQIAEIGCQLGTKAHAALTSTLVEFVRVVKTGSCPVVRQPDGGADESINTPYKSDTNSNHGNEAHDDTGTHSETETGIFFDIGSEVEATIADYADSGKGRSQSSPMVYPKTAHATTQKLSLGMTLCHHPQTVCETPVVPDIIADTEENNEEVRSDDNVETTLEAATDDDGEKEASAGGCGDEVTTRDASEETPCLTKPQWKISTSVKKSGRPKITQAARKKVDCEAMREMNQTTQNYYVRETQQEAYCFGKRHDRVTYANAGRGHYASRYLPESLFNDHETQMPENDVTVIVGRTVFEVPILRAMRKWHTTLDLFSGVETALAWVEKYDAAKGIVYACLHIADEKTGALGTHE